MTDNHPITPPPELVQQWDEECESRNNSEVNNTFDALQHFASKAARWGADQELLACGNYLEKCAAWEPEDVTEFYNYRRPRPPSLKEQAQAELDRLIALIPTKGAMAMAEPIRRALEQLDD
jgi:hypothetical protein